MSKRVFAGSEGCFRIGLTGTVSLSLQQITYPYLDKISYRLVYS